MPLVQRVPGTGRYSPTFIRNASLWACVDPLHSARKTALFRRGQVAEWLKALPC